MYAPSRMLIFETMSRSALCGVGTRFPGLGRGRAVEVPWPLVCLVAVEGSLFVCGYAIRSGLW